MTSSVSEKTLEVTVVAEFGHPATEQGPAKVQGTRQYTVEVDLRKRRSLSFRVDVPKGQNVLHWQLVPAGEDIIRVTQLGKQYVFPPAQPGEVLERQESLALARIGSSDYALSYQRLK
ncbi:MAG: hypothetical protein AABY13_04485 [Nanoarchaeota archaeon]